MQRLTTTTEDRVPLFVRIADADPQLRHYLFERQRLGMQIKRLSWYWRVHWNSLLKRILLNEPTKNLTGDSPCEILTSRTESGRLELPSRTNQS